MFWEGTAWTGADLLTAGIDDKSWGMTWGWSPCCLETIDSQSEGPGGVVFLGIKVKKVFFLEVVEWSCHIPSQQRNF